MTRDELVRLADQLETLLETVVSQIARTQPQPCRCPSCPAHSQKAGPS